MKFIVASGALGYDGNGYWFEQPWRWFNVLRPEEFIIITKTLTYLHRKGNYIWYKPWKSIKFIKNGIWNNYGLTNPGYRWWINEIYPTLKYKMIVSLMAETSVQAKEMALAFNKLDIVAIELNLSCPNIKESENTVEEFIENSKHKIILKLSYNQIDLYSSFKVYGFDLINSLPSEIISKELPKGGISGSCIKKYARQALIKARSLTELFIISGGGIDSQKEVDIRFSLGANAISFGTIFIKKPWLPNIIKRNSI